MKGEGWESVAFEELAEFHDRRRIPLSKKERVGRSGPFPYYGAQGIIDWVDDYIFDGRYLLIAEDGENLRSRKQAVAYTADGQFWVNNHAHVVKAMRGVADDDFLRAYVEFHPLNGLITGAAQPKLSQSNLKRLPVSAPPYAVQAKIGEAIRAVDSFLKNNRRRIEVLEEVARLLYREWFVHFRYPGHEEVELVDSDLGPIPEGWEIASVRDVADLVRGRSYRRWDLVEDGGLPFLNLKCIDRGGGFRKSGLKRYDGRFKKEQQTYPGDTVIAMTDMTQERNIVGQAGRVPSLNADFGIVSLDLARVVPADSVDPDYLYGMFRFSSFSETVKEQANGTNVLHLSPDRISQYRFTKPPVQMQRLYRDAVNPMFLLADNLTLQNEALRGARDLLLPRMVSGELDVSELDLGLEASWV